MADDDLRDYLAMMVRGPWSRQPLLCAVAVLALEGSAEAAALVRLIGRDARQRDVDALAAGARADDWDGITIEVTGRETEPAPAR